MNLCWCELYVLKEVQLEAGLSYCRRREKTEKNEAGKRKMLKNKKKDKKQTKGETQEK